MVPGVGQTTNSFHLYPGYGQNFNPVVGISGSNLAFGPNDNGSPCSYSVGVIYAGSVLVEVGQQTLNFLGQTRTIRTPSQTLADIAYGPISLDVQGTCSVGFIKIETSNSSPANSQFWTNFRNTRELLS